MSLPTLINDSNPLSLDEFLEIEKEFRLDEIEVGGIYPWDILRLTVWRRLMPEGYSSKIHSGRNGRQSRLLAPMLILKKIFSVAKELRLYGAVPSRPIIFYGLGNNRRQRFEDGKLWDIYCDPIIEFIGPERCYLIENVENLAYFDEKNIKTNNFMGRQAGNYSVLVFFRAAFFLIVNAKKFSIFWLNLTRAFAHSKNRISSTKAVIIRQIFYFLCEKFFWEEALRRLKPSQVVVVASYGKEGLISAARALAITTTELQHGLISHGHLGYSYSGIKKRYFPDRFLAFGDHFATAVKFPCGDAETYSVGVPWERQLSGEKTAYVKKILYCSQPGLGEQLAQHAVLMRMVLPEEIEIIFRPHPAEAETWMSDYGGHLNESIVIDSVNNSLHETLAKVQLQVGVYSTTLLEGLAYNCRAVVLELPGWHFYENEISAGVFVKCAPNRCFNLKDIYDKGKNFEVLSKRYFAKPFDKEKVKWLLLN